MAALLGAWLVLSLCARAQEPAAAASAVVSELGPFAVGFQVSHRVDPTRPFRDGAASAARPLQIAVWYPALPEPSAAGRGTEPTPPMLFGDYAFLSDSSGALGGAPSSQRSIWAESLRALIAPTFFTELDDELLLRIVEAPLQARLDRPRAHGEFPVLVWGKGEDGNLLDHAVLNEYLASWGYVVASTPALPARADRTERYDRASVEAQLGDLEFLLDVLSEPAWACADVERLGVLAWSFGGIPAALCAMTDERIGAVVSLDSRIGFRNRPDVFAELPGFDPSFWSAPVLHFTGSGEALVEGLKDATFLESLTEVERFTLTIVGARHRDFNLLWGEVLTSESLGDSWPVPPDRLSATIAGCTRVFLDATLGEQAEALDALAAWRAGELPDGVAELR